MVEERSASSLLGVPSVTEANKVIGEIGAAMKDLVVEVKKFTEGREEGQASAERERDRVPARKQCARVVSLCWSLSRVIIVNECVCDPSKEVGEARMINTLASSYIPTYLPSSTSALDSLLPAIDPSEGTDVITTLLKVRDFYRTCVSDYFLPYYRYNIYNINKEKVDRRIVDVD